MMENPETQQSILNSFHSNKEISENIQQYSKEVLSHIFEDLVDGALTISDVQIPFQSKKKNQLEEKEKRKQLIKAIQQTKKDMIIKLQQLYHEQTKMRLTIHQHQKKNKEAHMTRSQYSPEQKQKIRQILKARKDFEVHIKQKVLQALAQGKQKQKSLEKQHLDQLSYSIKKRRSEILSSQQKVKQERQKQTELIKNVKISKRVYTYQENQKRDQQLISQRKKYETMLLANKRQKLKTDYSILKKHAAQHDDFINKKKQQFEINHIQKSKQFVQPKFQQTKFMKKIKQEQQQSKIMNQRNKRQKYEFPKKRKQYTKYVTENFKPLSNEKSQFKPKASVDIRPEKSFHQRNEEGNKYLEIARKLRSKNPSPRSGFHVEENPVPKKKYQNYLNTLNNSTFSTIDSDEKKLNKLIKKKGQLSQGDIQQVIYLTKKMQHNNKVSRIKKKNQFNNARKKLKVLELLLEQKH